MDLNCDLGEGIGNAKHDPAIMGHITSANIACGAHAGDLSTMSATVAAAVKNGVVIGAHPGYADPENFGRVSLPLSPGRITGSVAAQVGALSAVCATHGASVQYVKLHGALYHDAANDDRIAAAVLGALDPALPILTLAGSAIGRLAAERGTPVFTEAFPDRAYRPDGTLVPRDEDGAVVDDPADVAARAVRLIRDGVIEATDGSEIRVDAASLCIHGDAPNAVAAAAALAARLADAGIVPEPFITEPPVTEPAEAAPVDAEPAPTQPDR